jgi:hypothetical protein
MINTLLAIFSLLGAPQDSEWPRYYYPVPAAGSPRTIESDLCVYGGTSGGVAAAVQMRRMGKTAVIAEFGRHLGGLSSGGLGATDIGNKKAIGGISREFYQALGRHYGKDEQWTFEPKVAERIFNDWVRDNKIDVRFDQRLKSVRKEGGRIVEIAMEDGTVYRAKMFIDATYEGDLLAKAGVSYHVGREANAQYGETINGVHFGNPNHNFKAPVDPYVKEGDPSSGLLQGISGDDPKKHGDGDKRVQAYNFRLCLTNVAENRKPIPKPPGYDPERYTLGARYLKAGVWDMLRLHVKMPNGKTDLNNFGGFSTDNIGRNYDWPDGDYATREKIFQDHVTYQMGLLWFLQNDERVPEKIRQEALQWGLPKDEFPGTGGWPHQLYVREGRRMISALVMTEHHCRGKETVEDSVGMGAYGMDSHNCNRIVRDGKVLNEGNVEVKVPKPYPISYRSVVPREQECANLLVPVCLSSSHIAYGSIRMEPVFMVLGQSCASAASFAIDSNVPVQKVDYPKLRSRLLEDKQVLENRE